MLAYFIIHTLKTSDFLHHGDSGGLVLSPCVIFLLDVGNGSEKRDDDYF